MADVHLLQTVFLKLFEQTTGRNFVESTDIVGILTHQWAGSLADIGDLQHLATIAAIVH
jgi:hypothetical protein